MNIYVIIGLFSLAALIGIYLLALVIQNKETPKFVSFIHGGFAATALVMLIVYASHNGPGLMESIVLFVMAALGGVVLIYKDLSKMPLPKWLAVLHGLLAVSGFIFLIVFACNQTAQ